MTGTLDQMGEVVILYLVLLVASFPIFALVGIITEPKTAAKTIGLLIGLSFFWVPANLLLYNKFKEATKEK